MPEASNELSIDFAAIAGEDSSAPKSPSESILDNIDPHKSLEEFSCRAEFTENQLVEVRKHSKNLLTSFKEDRSKLSRFGDGSLTALNNVVDQLLKEQGKLRIPEVERITKEMSKTVANFRKKYKNADPKMTQALERFADSIAGIFAAGQSFFGGLYIDSQSAVKRLDGVAGKLEEHQTILERNVYFCDEIYDKNSVGVVTLIGTVAIMEQLLEDMHADAVLVKNELDAFDQSDGTAKRKKQEELDLLIEMIEELATRRSEFVQRLYIGYTTAKQIRNLRKVSNSMNQRIHLLLELTIPVMKLTIGQWGMQVQAKGAMQAGQAVIDATNDALVEYAESSATSVKEIALFTQKPTLLPATIIALAESVVAQNEGLLAAAKEGYRLRAELDDTMVKYVRIMSNSQKNYEAEVIEMVTQAKKPLELDAAPDIPDVVKEYDLHQQQAA
jgi:uncharacterized protein YaaN involved in tellurite resistance